MEYESVGVYPCDVQVVIPGGEMRQRKAGTERD